MLERAEFADSPVFVRIRLAPPCTASHPPSRNSHMHRHRYNPSSLHYVLCFFSFFLCFALFYLCFHSLLFFPGYHLRSCSHIFFSFAGRFCWRLFVRCSSLLFSMPLLFLLLLLISDLCLLALVPTCMLVSMRVLVVCVCVGGYGCCGSPVRWLFMCLCCRSLRVATDVVAFFLFSISSLNVSFCVFVGACACFYPFHLYPSPPTRRRARSV